jgi:hypothetical protein
MKKNRIIVLLIGVPLIALGAGVATGMLASRLPAMNPAHPPQASGQLPLAEQLRLSDAQRDQMQQIWERAQSRVRRGVESAQQLQQQRDDALVALLNDEQKAAFEKISKEYADRYAELMARRDEEFSLAVSQTRKLLDEQQRQTYDQILRSHVGEQTLQRVSATSISP